MDDLAKPGGFGLTLNDATVKRLRKSAERVPCLWCVHAAGRPTPSGWRLWCAKFDTAAVRSCGDWQREPGSDDE